MNAFAQLTLIGIVPAALLSMTRYSPQRVVLWVFLGGHLFLPQGVIYFAGFPDYDRIFAASLAALLAVVTFDFQAVMRLRLAWYDLPMLGFCLVPPISSLVNGHGPYDAFSALLTQIVYWAIPYFLGRVYFANGPGLRILLHGLVVAGIIYVPLCVWEIRMGARLHLNLYGAFSRKRPPRGVPMFGLPGNGYLGFLDFGINSSTFMAMCALALLWSRVVGKVRVVWNAPLTLVAPAIVMVVILGQSESAYGALVFGVLLFIAVRFLRTRMMHYVGVGLILAYICARIAGWDALFVINLLGDTFTFIARIENATQIIDNCRERFLLGWGGWAAGYRIGTRGVDGLWIITFGKFGFFGVMGLYLSMLLPVLIHLVHSPRSRLRDPVEIAGIGLCTIIIIFMVHNLFNAMLMPPLVLAAGGLAAYRPGFTREDPWLPDPGDWPSPPPPAEGPW